MLNRTWLALVAAASLAACAPSRGPFDQWIDAEPINQPEAGRRAAAPLPASPRPPDRPMRAEADLPDGATVEDFVRLAVARHPAVRMATQRVHRLANRIPQVTSLDDPMFMVTPIGEMAETAAGQVGLMTGVSQRFPAPGKLDARGRVAAQDVAEAVQQLEAVRLEVIGDTRRAWWSHYYASRAIEVTARNRDLVSQFRDVADAKFRAGAAEQQDLLRASVELEKLESELVDLRQQLISARAMLNRMIDRPVETPIAAPPVQSIERIGLALDALLETASSRQPELQAWRERIEGYRQRHALARLERWPDLTVGFSYNLVDDEGLSAAATGDDQWWVDFGFNLPIWTDRLDAAEREAVRGRLESIAGLHDEMNRVEFRLQDSLSRVESHQRQALLYRDMIVPRAEQTVEASLSSYRAGTEDFLVLIESWRLLLAFELTYHHHLAQLEQSFADLQQAVGTDLSRDGTPAGRERQTEMP